MTENLTAEGTTTVLTEKKPLRRARTKISVPDGIPKKKLRDKEFGIPLDEGKEDNNDRTKDISYDFQKDT